MKTTTKNFARLFILSGILFFLNSIFAKSLGNVKGYVMDRKDNPIELATVTLTNVETQKTADGAMCDLNGNFVINDVTPGEYVLSVSMIGYKKCEPQNVTVEANETLILNRSFVLKDSVQKLAGVVVKAKRLTNVNSTDNGFATTKASNSSSAINLFSYISKGYNCVINSGMQIFDLTFSIKPAFVSSKNLFFK